MKRKNTYTELMVGFTHSRGTLNANFHKAIFFGSENLTAEVICTATRSQVRCARYKYAVAAGGERTGGEGEEEEAGGGGGNGCDTDGLVEKIHF